MIRAGEKFSQWANFPPMGQIFRCIGTIVVLAGSKLARLIWLNCEPITTIVEIVCNETESLFWHQGCVLVKAREKRFLKSLRKRSKTGLRVFLQTLTVAVALTVPFVSYGNDVDCSAQFGALSGAIDGADYARETDRTQLQGEVEAILDAVDDALTCIPGGLDSLPH